VESLGKGHHDITPDGRLHRQRCGQLVTPGPATPIWSPGLDFETRLFAKVNAAEVCARNWPSPAIVVNPSPSGPTPIPSTIEREWKITRQVLEVFVRVSTLVHHH
jgi:hypothetical protein